MSLSNYSDISTALATWLNRVGYTAITDNAEDFIIMAQRRIAREMRIPPMEAVQTLTVDSAGEADIPTDYMQTKYLVGENSNRSWVLQHAPFHEVKKKQVSANYEEPRVFDTEGDKFYIGAIPRSGDSFTLVYYKEIEFISTTVSSNWFSVYAPELILFGAMAEAAFFMKDWDLETKCEAKYTQAKTLLIYQKDKGEYSGSPLKVSVGG